MDKPTKLEETKHVHQWEKDGGKTIGRFSKVSLQRWKCACGETMQVLAGIDMSQK